MEKIKSFFTDFIATRKITYYIVLGLSVLAFIMGIVATASLADAGATALPLVFTLLGLLVFLGLSVIGLEKFGAGVVSLASFISLVVLVCEVFEFYLGAIQDQAMGGFNIFEIEGIVALIVCVAVFLVCSIAVNVMAWLKLSKPKAAAKDDAPEQNGTESATAQDETAAETETALKTEETENE